MLKKIKKLIRKYLRRFNKFYTLKIIFPLVYKWNARKPVDESKVILVEVRFDGISNSFSEIYQRLSEDKKFNVHVHNLGLTFVKTISYDKNCIKLLRDMATAKYVFLNEASNTVSCVKKRSETVVFQTWHGCGAFKRFGFSTAQLIFGETEKSMLKYPFYNNIDYLSVSSPEVVWAYEEATNSARYGTKVIPIGISRSDFFFNEQNKQKAFDRLYEIMPQARGKKVIMYAPTFRGRVAAAKAPNRLNIELMNYALSDEYVLIIKHHPFVRKRPEVAPQCENFALDVSELMTIDDMMFVSDMCISDYSSLVFEYSLFEKPMIFLAYDLDEYIDWRGFYYPYEELVPGPIVDNTLDIVDFVKNIDSFDKEKVVDFRKKFMSSCDGHATDRIFELVFGNEKKPE